MRKRILSPAGEQPPKDEPLWFDLETMAEIEVSSEDPGHPIEAALISTEDVGWQASENGEQTLRVHFDSPQHLHRIRLWFREESQPRTQEFCLAWAFDAATLYQQIVRQQFNFSPPGTVEEREDYRVNLQGVKSLELVIKPDIGTASRRASLLRMQIA